MQKPVKRGNAWRIQVKYKHLRDAATKDTSQECIQWAHKRLMELQLEYEKQLKNLDKPQYTVKQLFNIYYEKIGQFTKSKVYIKNHIKYLERYYGKLTEYSIYDLTPKLITENRERRLQYVKAGTIHKEMSLGSSVFTFAVRELFLLPSNPFNLVKKPIKPPARKNRISQDQIKMVLVGLDNYEEGMVPKTPAHYVAWSFLFALETAMRKGEILGIENQHVFPDYVHLPDTKNGTSRDVPLTTKARALLDILPKREGLLVKHNSNSFRLLWQRNLKRVGLAGAFTFHDSRHEAITRFVNNQKLPVEILAKLTGHKTIGVLVNTYYNPTASEIAKMLNAA
ncbi:tyrosine-type recombinase/integrase [Acinetobacter sp. WCHAc060042]|uniref:tyrosine-type recombinase/integrase n=1 Tax=Acinetobacter sp. WCHAc060042 TaxID=2213016 RepID=UPI000DA6C431|nr:site-specific integrase [Acinetobacter sp. WCHAc060042]